MRLDDKVIIVTGSGGGLGRAIAVGCAAAGGRLIISDVNEVGATETARSIREAGGVAHVHSADVSSAGDIAALIRTSVDHYGRLDVMINNAGRAGQIAFLDLTEADWDRVLNTNLRGLFLCCQAAARQMIEQGDGGRIVNITSALGEKGARSSAHYAASKGGVNAFTRSIAAELAPHDIDVVAAGPGPTDTDMLRSMYRPDELDERRAAGHLQDIDQFVNLVVFLASPAASGLSGQVIARNVYVPT